MIFCCKYENKTPIEQKLSSNFSLTALTNEPQELTKLNSVWSHYKHSYNLYVYDYTHGDDAKLSGYNRQIYHSLKTTLTTKYAETEIYEGRLWVLQ